MRKFWTASPKTSSFLEKSKFEGYKWKKWTHFRKRVRKLGENLLFSGKESNTHLSFFGRNNKMYVVIKYIHMQNMYAKYIEGSHLNPIALFNPAPSFVKLHAMMCTYQFPFQRSCRSLKGASKRLL